MTIFPVPQQKAGNHNTIAWWGLVLFFMLVAGDFISFSTRILPGFPAIPFGIITYTITVLSILVIVPLKIIHIKPGWSTWLILGLFTVFLLYIALRLLVDKQSIGLDYYLVLRYLIYFLLGLYAGHAFLSFTLKKVFALSYILILSIMAGMINFNDLSFLFLSEDGLNYLRLAESFVIISIGLLCYIERSTWSTLTFFSASIMLFFINSRFALAAFVLVGLMIMVYRYRFRGIIILVFSMTATLLILGQLIDFNALLSFDNRIFRLILTPEMDTSLLSRQQMSGSGIEAIRKNWFLGDFRGQVAYGGYGAYIHNILSYWRQYGFIAFFLLITLLIIAWIKVIRWFYTKELKKPEFLFGASFLLYTTLGLIIAKSFVYTEIFMALGFVTILSQKGLRNMNDQNTQPSLPN